MKGKAVKYRLLVFTLCLIMGMMFALTAYAGDPPPEAAITESQVSTCTGAVNHSIPIAAPGGPGGMKPGISAFYSTLDIDNKSFLSLTESRTAKFGHGWSLQGIMSIRQTVKDGKLEDEYTLETGGFYGVLAKGDDGYYHAEHEDFSKIRKRGNYWIIQNPDGTNYRLGYNEDSRHQIVLYGDQYKLVDYIWEVDNVRDIYGYQMDYKYKEYKFPTCGEDGITRLEKITYTKRSAEDVVLAFPFNEGAGILTDDCSGNSNHGLLDGAAWVNGRAGQGLSFNNTSCVTTQYDSTMDIREKLSIEAWINPSDNAAYSRIVSKGIAPDWDFFMLRGDNNNVGFVFKTGGVEKGAYSDANTVPTGQWSYVVGTYDGSNVRLYINGQLQKTVAAEGLIDNHGKPIMIGKDECGEQSMNGIIDEVAIYKKALSESEISTRYASTAQPPTNSGMVLYYHCDEGPGSTMVIDSSGNGNTGTPKGIIGWLDGKIGKALNFGYAGYVTTAYNNTMNITNAVSVEAWVKPERAQAWGRIVTKGGGGSDDDFVLLQGDNQNFGFVFKTGGIEKGAYSNPGTVPVGQWTHIAGTYDGSNVRIYVNGQLQKTVAASGVIDNHYNGIRLGKSLNNANSMNGMVDEVAVYNRALSDQEIASRMGASILPKAEFVGQPFTLEFTVADENGYVLNEDVKKHPVYLRNYMRYDQIIAKVNGVQQMRYKFNYTSSLVWTLSSVQVYGDETDTVPPKASSFTYNWINGGTLPKHLASVTNSNGGSTSYLYTLYNDLVAGSQRARVNTVTSNDGTGRSYAIRYSYGDYRYAEGEFRGHDFVTVTDNIGTKTEYTYNYLDKSTAGTVQSSTIKYLNPDGKTYSTYLTNNNTYTDDYFAQGKQISVGTDGALFAVDKNNIARKWNGSRWTTLNKGIISIAVRNANEVWGIGTDSYVYKYDGNAWTKVTDNQMSKIAVGQDGTVWAIGSGDYATTAYMLNQSTNSWIFSYAGLSDIAVRNANEVYGIHASYKHVWKYNGSSWSPYIGYGKHSQVAVGSDSPYVYTVSADATIGVHEVSKWTNGYTFTNLNMRAHNIAVRNGSEIYGLKQDSDIKLDKTVTKYDGSSWTRKYSAYVCYSASTEELVYNGGSVPHRTGKEFTYDMYGNIIKIINKGDIDKTGDELYSYVEFINDTNNWVLGIPKHSYVKGSDDTTMLEESWNYYANTYDGAPDYGNSYKYLRKMVAAAVFGDPGNADNVVGEIIYDKYANIVATIDPMGVYSGLTTYDSIFHMLPVKSVNALDQIESEKFYYGVNADGDSSFSGHGLFGQIKSTKDINGNYLRTKYDSMGRPKIVWSGEFTETYPQITYEYTPWINSNNPNRLVSKVRKEKNSSETWDTYNYTDGLGRLLQVQAPTDETGKIYISGLSDYDNCGRLIKSYVSYKATNTGAYIANPIKEKPTTMEYDKLGRVIKTINPDGTYTTQEHGILQHTTIDYYGSKTRVTSDVYGRVVEKETIVGDDVYASTKYTYNQLGLLTKVIDPQNNENTMTYDNFGRKIASNDMDMGNWTYEYDKLGRLIKQTDAKGQSITMQYDVLGRLIQKTNSDGTWVKNYYDNFDGYTGTNALGRLLKTEEGRD